MDVKTINIMLAGIALASGAALIGWRRSFRSVFVALLFPILLNAAFWGFHYLGVAAGNGTGERGWISLFFINGCLWGYGMSVPGVILTWFLVRKRMV